MRHALESVIKTAQCGIPEKVEKEKCIDQVPFSHIGYWELLIADEEVTFNKGD